MRSSRFAKGKEKNIEVCSFDVTIAMVDFEAVYRKLDIPLDAEGYTKRSMHCDLIHAHPLANEAGG